MVEETVLSLIIKQGQSKQAKRKEKKKLSCMLGSTAFPLPISGNTWSQSTREKKKTTSSSVKQN